MAQKKRKSQPAQAKKKVLPIVNAKTASSAGGSGAFAAAQARANGKKMVLHIGCGVPSPHKLHKIFRNDDWYELRLDIDVNVQPDIIADMTDMSMIPDNSVHAVWSSHNLEHLYPHLVPVAMAEIFRVLAPEGMFLVTMPDVQMVANYVAHGTLDEPIYDSPAGPICPIDILYGLRSSMAQGNLFMAHRTAFTAKTLGEQLRDAGFTNIRISRNWVDLWGAGYKYPHGHPERLERIVVLDETAKSGREVPTLPAPLPLNRAPHPGMIAGQALTDELDVPPRIWEPVRLS